MLGSYYGAGDARVQLATVFDLYKQGRFKLDEMITKRYSFEEINTGFEDLATGKNARGVIIY
jgi:S-(hydroxymethyl)glutathione dehydrogenase/alcohol dehydrogenase